MIKRKTGFPEAKVDGFFYSKKTVKNSLLSINQNILQGHPTTNSPIYQHTCQREFRALFNMQFSLQFGQLLSNVFYNHSFGRSQEVFC